MNRTDQIRIKIQPELKALFKEYCDANYKDMSGLLRDYIITLVNQEGN